MKLPTPCLAALLALTLGAAPACTTQDTPAASANAEAEGRTFLAEKAKQEGVQKSESGLHYKILAAGEGTKPGPTSSVTVHYVGTLIDGTKFDSSRDRGEPITFPLDRVIPGWTEGLQLIAPGGKVELYIPYELAYGTQGRPPVIPPYATLVFEVELLEVK